MMRKRRKKEFTFHYYRILLVGAIVEKNLNLQLITKFSINLSATFISSPQADSYLEWSLEAEVALNLLLQAQVSSIPIVDENNSLLDIHAGSDIISLANDNIYSRTKLDDMTIHQVLPLDLSSQRCHMCVRFDTLYKVMEELPKPGDRRLVIVEAPSRRVEGIISLRDIFEFLLG